MRIFWNKILLSFSLLAMGVVGYASIMLALPVYAATPTDIKTQVLGPETETGKLYAGFGVNTQGGALEGRARVMLIIQQILTFVYGILGMLMVGYTLYGGWLYMTAAGNDDQVEEALTIIRNAVIGLAIIVAAALITSIVVNIIVCWVSNGTAQGCTGGTSSWGGAAGAGVGGAAGSAIQGR